MERRTGRVEAVVALDRRAGRKALDQAAAVLMQHPAPAQLVEQACQTRSAHRIPAFGRVSCRHRQTSSSISSQASPSARPKARRPGMR